MLVGGAVWVGALLGSVASVEIAAVVIGVGVLGTMLTRFRPLLLVAFVGIGLLSGSYGSVRNAATLGAELPAGGRVVVGAAATDAMPYGEQFRFVLRPSWIGAGLAGRAWDGPSVAVVTDQSEVTAGDTVEVSGRLRRWSDTVRGDPVAGRITAKDVVVLSSSGSWAVTAGNAVRSRVRARLMTLGDSPEAALLSGFLIGDIAALPRSDSESLRRAGLTHYVAVSGSNVAMVLGALWLVLGPLGAGSRMRAIAGMVALVVFVVATRWESSVIRAATMAAIVLGGRAAGVVIGAWGALGAAVAILLAISGDLAFDIGFQLSVVATCGVLAGMNYWQGRSPRLFWGLLAATISAQLAVVPLLLIHFGSIPLLSPVANLLAAPLVSLATASAGLGVIVNWDVPLRIAGMLAGMVLGVARAAGQWPQLDTVASVGVIGLLMGLWPTRARWGVLGAVLVVSATSVLPPGAPDTPTIVFLDVGQGDAVLLRDPSGGVALIDGGRDPAVLLPALRRHGVNRIDLLVATHGDADHVGGLATLADHVAIGRVWVPQFAELGPLLAEVADDVRQEGVVVDEVAAGGSAVLGQFSIEVLGPRRRYATDNDGSVVLLVTAGGRTVVLPGDIGAITQGELDLLPVDVLMVPHHGAATSDPNWLTAVAGPIAVISVGPNTYGHPAPEVMAALAEAGTTVLTTWEQGDITIALR
ncbi:MAG: MBL fold metallo-hydrolase [bacterium]|nr:MBL fold metallo-hydrolase [bacterium]